jgi:hypothetical protein
MNWLAHKPGHQVVKPADRPEHILSTNQSRPVDRVASHVDGNAYMHFINSVFDHFVALSTNN